MRSRLFFGHSASAGCLGGGGGGAGGGWDLGFRVWGWMYADTEGPWGRCRVWGLG